MRCDSQVRLAGWLRVAGSNRISIGGSTSLIPHESYQSAKKPFGSTSEFQAFANSNQACLKFPSDCPRLALSHIKHLFKTLQNSQFSAGCIAPKKESLSSYRHGFRHAEHHAWQPPNAFTTAGGMVRPNRAWPPDPSGPLRRAGVGGEPTG